MCGRIALYTPPERLARVLDAALDAAGGVRREPSWNVAPSRGVLVLRAPRRPRPPDGSEGSPDGSAETPRRVLTTLRWGLVPSWAKDPSIGNRMINARAETLATKAAFRRLLARRRCLVVADGFYEWQVNPTEPKRKIPYYFERADGRPLTLAALWDVWHDPVRPDDPDAVLRTCTIVTTDAGPDLVAVHDRMPVIVEPNDIDRWLDRDVEDPEPVVAILHPSARGVLLGHRVGTAVNAPRNDGPELIDEVPPDESGEDEGTRTPAQPSRHGVQERQLF